MKNDILKKLVCRSRQILTISLFGVALSANAIEYSAPGNPAKLRVFESGTNNLVCYSFMNFCDLPAGPYTVKVYNALTRSADEVFEIVLTEGGDATDTLAQLNCENGDVAKYVDGVWSCAKDIGADITVFDKVAMLEEFFCTADEMLWRDPDSGVIKCEPQIACPYASTILNIESAFNQKTGDLDTSGVCSASYDDWDGPAGNTPLTGALLYVDVNEFVVDIFTLERESTSVDDIDSVDEGRACAVLMGCTNF